MSRILFIFFFNCLFASSIFAQTDKSFTTNDLQALITADSNKYLTTEDAMDIISAHTALLLPPYDLIALKNEIPYRHNIVNFVNSEYRAQRLLAYFLVAAAKDSSFESTLLKRLNSEKDTPNLIWAATALMYMNSTHTTPLFDFLVTYEDFDTPRMITFYALLNKDSLRQTAYNRINNPNAKAKILSIQLLSQTGLNPQTEIIVRDAVKDWDYKIKGYALYTLQELQIGNILELIKPILSDNKAGNEIRRLALIALSNSPDVEDRKYIAGLAAKENPISEGLLDCFIYSKRPEQVKLGLHYLYAKKIPENYSINISQQPLLATDDLLTDVQQSLKRVTTPATLYPLILLLKGRHDKESESIMIDLLKHTDPGVKQRAAYIMKGVTSPGIIGQLPALIRNSDASAVYLADIAITNGIDTLQSEYENLYEKTTQPQWQTIAVKYLSTYPIINDRAIFRNILESKMGAFKKIGDKTITMNSAIRQMAAMGLARLKDESSVDLIITELTRVTQMDDANGYEFLLALSMIKTEKSMFAIKKYSNSADPSIKRFVEKTLKNW